MPLLVCNIGWMERYQGLEGAGDQIVGGGRFVNENERGGEVCNFVRCEDGYVYGHVETIRGEKDRQIVIENLGANRWDEKIEGIDVVWTATHPQEGGRRVVGWYSDAILYRHRREFEKFPSPQHKRDGIDSYRICARNENAILLPLEKRSDPALRLGTGRGWMGHANWWLPERRENENDEIEEFVHHLREIIHHPRRNPTWVRDELILALNLYLRHKGNPPQKDSAEIKELSATLSLLGRYLGIATEDRFRNVNGVYMKLMNFRRFDPVFTQSGRRGLSRGGQAEEEVWNEFASDPKRCDEVAQAIRQALAEAQEGETITSQTGNGSEETEAEEGRVITALHHRYERDAGIVRAKKQAALARFGRLACEVCKFDFRKRYGERGDGFIECHHTRPVHMLKPGEKTKASDLVLLCANCHRMVHAKRQWLSMDQLVTILRKPE